MRATFAQCNAMPLPQSLPISIQPPPAVPPAVTQRYRALCFPPEITARQLAPPNIRKAVPPPPPPPSVQQYLWENCVAPFQAAPCGAATMFAQTPTHQPPQRRDESDGEMSPELSSADVSRTGSDLSAYVLQRGSNASSVKDAPKPQAAENVRIAKKKENDSTASPLDPRKYKTQLCRNWMQTGVCAFGQDCAYAHGEGELRRPNDRMAVMSVLQRLLDRFRQDTQQGSGGQVGCDALPALRNLKTSDALDLPWLEDLLGDVLRESANTEAETALAKELPMPEEATDDEALTRRIEVLEGEVAMLKRLVMQMAASGGVCLP